MSNLKTLDYMSISESVVFFLYFRKNITLACIRLTILQRQWLCLPPIVHMGWKRWKAKLEDPNMDPLDFLKSQDPDMGDDIHTNTQAMNQQQ